MAKVKKGIYEIGAGWPGGQAPLLWVDDQMKVIQYFTSGKTFEQLEQWYKKPLPTAGKLDSRPRIIPDLIEGGAAEPIVTGAFKSVVETVAPGEAEFRPFQLRWRDDSAVPGEHYLCNILNQVDCFDFDYMGQRKPEPLTHAPLGEPLTPEEARMRETFVNRAVRRPNYIDPAPIGALHIFRPRWRAMTIFVTSELLNALREAGVKGPRTDRLGTREEVYRGNNPQYRLPPGAKI